MNIQWYPGHMAKTKRLILESLSLIDVVCEVVDARIPQISRNPDIDTILKDKPRIIVMNKTDLADPEATKAWADHFRKCGYYILEVNSKSGAGTDRLGSAIKTVMAKKIEAFISKGQTGRKIRMMIVGIPNVGKSSLINRIAQKKSTKTEDRPGVTRGKQWVSVGTDLELLDTPGVLWPKLKDERTGLFLAFTGAVKDNILDVETLACKLFEVLAVRSPQALTDRYKLQKEDMTSGYEMLKRAAKKRGFIVSGGELDLERMSRILLDEFREGRLGRITLELPEDYTEGSNEQHS